MGWTYGSVDGFMYGGEVWEGVDDDVGLVNKDICAPRSSLAAEMMQSLVKRRVLGRLCKAG